MNLRKDHYRSFTRTLRTVSFLGGVSKRRRRRLASPVLAWRSLRRVGHAPCFGSIVSVQFFGRAPRLALVRSPPTQQITQLLSVDILAR